MALPLPNETDNPLRLADWLEIYALISDGLNSSRGDLERALNRSGIPEEDIEAVCSDAFTELNLRKTAAGTAYPFNFDNSAIELQGNLDSHFSYIFCLLLSYFGAPTKIKKEELFPRRLFEDLSAQAAKNFLPGDAYRFAAPRKDDPEFSTALEKLINRMGEGEAIQHQEDRSPQDDNLDVVAWRHFPDKLEGKLILYGQCATGEDWSGDKLNSLNPLAFGHYWLRKQPAQIVKAYFIPHRVEQRIWHRATTYGGIIFDRCRICYWVESGKKLKVIQPYSDWIKKVLANAK